MATVQLMEKRPTELVAEFIAVIFLAIPMNYEFHQPVLERVKDLIARHSQGRGGGARLPNGRFLYLTFVSRSGYEC